eukprot:XP_011668769.1 PREDICTED: uncharacterized protein LOC105440394 [Strongylocentrotus purpuratus]
MDMPRKLRAIKLLCPTATCAGQELTSAGMHTVVRHVLDIDGWYNMASEYLECKTCKKKYISWSNEILKQLDVGHRVQFPAVLTYPYTCDLRVVRLLRMRGVGNSSHLLRRKLVEQHSEAWLHKTACYLTDCQTFHQASSRGLVNRPTFEKPVEMPKLPTAAWLLTVFCSDILSRIEEVKASITSIFGRVLKLDSTKKMVKKLAGHADKTAAWVTNVGNEYGQVLMSVLTEGIIRRYADAGVAPPELLYVDRDCCNTNSRLRRKFEALQDMTIRSDIWHRMRRLATGCSTDSHQLYNDHRRVSTLMNYCTI